MEVSTAASYAFIQECTRAEKYHNESFKIVKDEGIENYTTDRTLCSFNNRILLRSNKK